MSERRTVTAGATVLALSKWQAYRLLARYEADGRAELNDEAVHARHIHRNKLHPDSIRPEISGHCG